jgi:hypothetical protein
MADFNQLTPVSNHVHMGGENSAMSTGAVKIPRGFYTYTEEKRGVTVTKIHGLE